MKFKIACILLFFLLSSRAQKNIEYIQMPTCSDGIRDAKQDAKKGEFVYVSYGLSMTTYINGFPKYYEDYIKNNYGILLEQGGCVITEYSKCYKDKTKELIFKKYGEKVFEIAKQEAALNYKSTKEYIEKIKPKIDSGYVYRYIPFLNEPEFIIDNKEVNFIKYLGFPDFEIDYFNQKKYCQISFVVEKDGSLSEFKLQNTETSKAISNKVLINKLQKSPKWRPARYLEEPVRYSVNYKVPLDLL